MDFNGTNVLHNRAMHSTARYQEIRWGEKEVLAVLGT